MLTNTLTAELGNGRMAVVRLPDRLWATVIQFGCFQRNSIDVRVLLSNFQLGTKNKD